MSDPWAAILTAVVSGGLVLAGVLGTLRHRRRLAAERREEERLNAQRKVVAAVVAAAREKGRALEDVYLVDADSPQRGGLWQRHDELCDDYERLLTEALLTVGDREVVDALERARAVGPLYHYRLGPPNDDDADHALQVMRMDLAEAIDELQEVAAGRFRRTPRERQARRLRRKSDPYAVAGTRRADKDGPV